MRALIEYDDFAIHFEPDAQPGRYRCWLLPMTPVSSPAFFNACPFLADHNPGLESSLVFASSCGREVRRRQSSGDGIDLQNFGLRLFQALFQENLREALEIARRNAEEAGRGLRLRLVAGPVLDPGEAEILSLPWELLYDRDRRDLLCQNPRLALVRHLRPAKDLSPRVELLDGSLRILIVTPAPRGFAELDTEEERQRLSAAQSKRKRLELDPSGPRTLAEMRTALRDFDPHVVHFAGHGNGAGLCFEQEDSSLDLVSFERLAEVLAGVGSLRVAVINACESGRIPPRESAAAKASLALLGRLPAVIAMQRSITDRAAIAFSGSFYDAIAAGDPLEAAMAEGRQAIRLELGNAEAAIPALYLRRADGQIFRPIERSDLAKWIRPQDDLVRELSKSFVGRSFVFEKIERFLANEQKRGYFLLQGDPGIGKSALLSRWIRDKNAICHFNIRNDDHCNRSRHFLGNLCSQLILRFQLPYPNLSEDALSGPRFLEQVLREVSEKRLGEDERLLIAVDALDEVVEDPGSQVGNLLHLPRRLPQNVFFVLTSRRPPKNQKAPRLRFDVALEIFDLEHDSSENLADIYSYIDAASTADRDQEASLEQWWRARSLDRGEFMKLMAERSEGNFRYLAHVLPEVVNGHYRDEGTETLPQGLINYYEDHWRRLRELCGNDWQLHQLPVLGALTVVKRPLELELIHYLTRIESVKDVLAVLLSWEAFLHVRRHPSARILLQTYRFYHGTFIEFIEHQPEVKLLIESHDIEEFLLREAREQDLNN